MNKFIIVTIAKRIIKATVSCIFFFYSPVFYAQQPAQDTNLVNSYGATDTSANNTPYVVNKKYAINLDIRKNIFDANKYGFSVLKFIDGRLDKKKPVAFVPSGWNPNNMLAYSNDSLEENINSTLKNKRAHFDTTTKMIVLLKQLWIRSYNTYMVGHTEEREVTLSLDYYKSAGTTCTLVCQQYFKYVRNTTYDMGSKKNVPVAFSKALEMAFTEFDTLLKLNARPPFPEVLDTARLYSFFQRPPFQLVNGVNVKDGLYFSSRDLYLDKPALIHFTPADTSELVKKPVILKTNDFLSKRAFAIVINKRVFIYSNNDYYIEFFFNEKGKLYFYPEITSRSAGTNATAAAASIGTSLFLGGIIGTALGAAASRQIKNNGTVRATKYVELDLGTGVPVVDYSGK